MKCIRCKGDGTLPQQPPKEPNVNDETRTALIELWRDVPGCTLSITASVGRSTQAVTYDDRRGKWSVEGPFMPCDFDDRIIEALARDAIVEWLHGQGVGEVQSGKTYDKDESDWYMVWVSGTVRGEGPTRLSALIAAARAVKGAERGQ